jgi:hypothetical protein
MKIRLPGKLRFLMADKARYKVAYGGRGAGKSFAFADSLLARAIESPVRVLCTRELQNTIKDSVHRLLSDRIAFYGLSEVFTITENEIRAPNGSLFIFKGLRSNPTEIKSLEGVDLCWVEEAQRVSEESWELLIPTIRNPGSEIWISFNTGTENDPVYKRFVAVKRDDAIVVMVNYYDNPWFPDVLEQDRRRDEVMDPRMHEHTWLGKPMCGGMFFTGFGPHLRIPRRMLDPGECRGRLFGSLDGGTTHPTSFGLWWIGKQNPLADIRTTGANDGRYMIQRVMSYYAANYSHREHAEAVCDLIGANVFTGGFFPDLIWADPSMWTKVRLNEQSVRSPIDEYIDEFRARNRTTRVEKANNAKPNGCQLMRMLFTDDPSLPEFRYWEGNTTFEDGIARLVVDDNNPEIYAKMDGDDEGDQSRYGLLGCYTVVSTLRQNDRTKAPKSHLDELLSRRTTRSREAVDWYSA